MNPRHQEDKQLQDFLNKLDELPLLEPNHGFTDKVMQGIDSIDSSSTVNNTSAGSRSPKWKQNAFHGCIAAAATILFVSTGMLHKVLAISDQVVQLSTYIEKISLYLVS
ncbi:hypothetical protein J2T13_002454 [Paenibacillus sp. DS2015]|uniref:hypothetical protein n=1 Tax=Paenibacillus sp. DS2015 TaxID=3373917 RepID=UPI003D22CF58